MESIFYTYQEFYTHTKAIIYILIIASLIGVALFWNFLAGKDDEIVKDDDKTENDV